MENITSFVQSIFLSFGVAPRKKKVLLKMDHPSQEFFFWKDEKLIAKNFFFCKIDFF